MGSVGCHCDDEPEEQRRTLVGHDPADLSGSDLSIG